MKERSTRRLVVWVFVVAAGCNRHEEPQDNIIEETVIHGSEPAKTAAQTRLTLPEQTGDDPAAPLPGLRRRPTSPDPQNGEFTLAEATDGLPESDAPLYAQLRTDLGRITCKLFADKAPRTVANFVGLTRGKREFWDPREAAWVKRPAYDGTIFHRVIPGFMIQGGDSLGDGTGTPGYTIGDENWEGARHDRAGLLCMARRREPNSAGSQFFITDAAADHLDGSYTIFGECTPTEVVARIARVPQAGRPDNRPLTPVRIESLRITRGEPPPPPPTRPAPSKRPPR